MYPIEFNNVWKKFKKGERFNSVRDALPNFFRQTVKKTNNNGVLLDREFWALKNVSFQVKQGDVLGIIGPNGAGKSTILKLLSRIMAPTKGDIKIRGRLSALIEVTAGFHPELTGRENTYLNGTIIGMKKKEIDRKFESIVEFSGLSEFIDTPVKRYSSGMYSRLGFSIAAHMDPDILLVDEVLAVGDMAFQAKCAEKMRNLLNSGATIILVSHNISLIQSLCKRAVLLSSGEVLKEGATNEVVPYYEDIVYKQREKEIKKELSSQSYELELKEESPVEILDVLLSNGNGERKEEFNTDESISIKVDYEAKEKIENPIFSLDVVRADGVLCCSSNTKDNGISAFYIYGQGTVRVDLGKINLAPGIYIANVSIWDKDMIHTYAIRKKDIFRIMNAKGQSKKHNIYAGVFINEFKWEL